MEDMDKGIRRLELTLDYKNILDIDKCSEFAGTLCAHVRDEIRNGELRDLEMLIVASSVIRLMCDVISSATQNVPIKYDMDESAPTAMKEKFEARFIESLNNILGGQDE